MVYIITKTLMGRYVNALWKISDPTGFKEQAPRSSYLLSILAYLNGTGCIPNMQIPKAFNPKKLLFDAGVRIQHASELRSFTECKTRFVQFLIGELATPKNPEFAASLLQAGRNDRIWLNHSVRNIVIRSKFGNFFPESGIFKLLQKL
jgi:hypothetical protein